MKRICLSALFCLTILSANAQDQKYNFDTQTEVLYLLDKIGAGQDASPYQK